MSDGSESPPPSKQPLLEMTPIGWLWQSWADPAVAKPAVSTNYGTVEEASPSTKTLDVEEAMERLGMGAFQYQILIVAGLCFGADAMEVLLLSFLAIILKVEWGLEEHEVDTIISVVFAGAMLGTLVLNPLGDIIGRRPVFTLTAAIIAVFGVGTAFCTTYEWLLLVRFMVGFGVGGLVVPFDTLAEFLPSSLRGANLLYIEFFWTGGTLLVPVFAWMSLGHSYEGKEEEGSWQLFCILCAIPCILSTVFGICFVPESPRWLLTMGRDKEALEILRGAAIRNGLDPNEILPEGTRLVQSEVEEHGNVCDLFAPKWRRITSLLWVAWFGLAFLYYGAILAVSMVFTSVEVMDENGEGGTYDFDYQAIFVSGSAEVVGLCLAIFTIERWGRIPTQVFTYLVGGVSCLLLGLAAHVDASRPVLLAFAFSARFAMMGATCTTWVSTSEILTTDIRATGHGAANAMARFGGFLCPYIISEGTPSNVIGILMLLVSCITAVVSWHLPETAGKAMGEVQKSESHEEKKESQQEYKLFN